MAIGSCGRRGQAWLALTVLPGCARKALNYDVLSSALPGM